MPEGSMGRRPRDGRLLASSHLFDKEGKQWSSCTGGQKEEPHVLLLVQQVYNHLYTGKAGGTNDVAVLD